MYFRIVSHLTMEKLRLNLAINKEVEASTPLMEYLSSTARPWVQPLVPQNRLIINKCN
jgi:hypothetical protein